jgi:hypothetical protein
MGPNQSIEISKSLDALMKRVREVIQLCLEDSNGDVTELSWWVFSRSRYDPPSSPQGKQVIKALESLGFAASKAATFFCFMPMAGRPPSPCIRENNWPWLVAGDSARLKSSHGSSDELADLDVLKGLRLVTPPFTVRPAD